MIKDGFIVPDESRNSFQFTHDYVRQAIFSMVPTKQRDLAFLNIGMVIWKKSSKMEMQDNIILVAQMLNSSLHKLNAAEKKDVAEINYQAAQKCKSLTAFKSALGFLEIGVQLLNDDCWDVDYKFM